MSKTIQVSGFDKDGEPVVTWDEASGARLKNRNKKIDFDSGGR